MEIFINCWIIIFHFIYKYIFFSQGINGEKGQKGDVGHPGIDVFQTVKVIIELYLENIFISLF